MIPKLPLGKLRQLFVCIVPSVVPSFNTLPDMGSLLAFRLLGSIFIFQTINRVAYCLYAVHVGEGRIRELIREHVGLLYELVP